MSKSLTSLDLMKLENEKDKKKLAELRAWMKQLNKQVKSRTAYLKKMEARENGENRKGDNIGGNSSEERKEELHGETTNTNS